MPYTAFLERVRFGEAAAASVLEGFGASDAAVMIIGASDDEMVSAEIGYDKFEAAYQNDPQFEFRMLDGRGHNDLFLSSAARAYREQVRQDYSLWLESTGTEKTPGARDAFCAEYMDYKLYNELDAELLNQIVAFYDSNLAAV